VAFTLGRARPITLAVYDLKGRRVRELARGTWSADRHVVTWNGRDNRGRELASGVYFVRLTAGAESAVTKVTLIK
jgi:flagellar hook assembly protein FlgD